MKKVYEWIDALWVWIAKLVFVRFEFDLPVEALRQSNENGRVIFALTRGGIMEWLILTSWCRSQGFGAILVANRKRILLFSKPKYFFQILFRTRKYADLFLDEAETGPRLLFCPSSERKQPFVPTAFERIFSDIYSGAASRGKPAWFTLFPVLILWRKHVRGEARRLSEYLFGLSSSPNVVGKVWYLFRRRKDSTVRALPPFSPSSIKEAHDDEDDPEAMRIAKQVRRRILILNNQEMRVALGPRYHSPHSVKETLMRDPDIQRLIDEIAKSENVDRRKVMSRAYRNFTEIVSSYSFRFVEVMYVFLEYLFNKVFEGVVVREEELQALREVAKTKPVVLVPCHRSHLDYLVIPYVLFLQDIITPHIAAGINLAFWPAGYFLRMGGAFFIRRSFRGDALYSLCLKKYVEHLVKNRYLIMFFIEGTRSRSGKMLAPAYGMLKMTLEAYARKQCDDIALVPVSLCYDEVPEQGSYTKELAGGQKTKESAKELIKSREVLRRKYGKVYVRLAQPIYARQVYKAASETGMDDTLMLQKTAFHLCKSINDVTPITPKSLVSSILLAHVMDSITLEDMLRLSLMLAKYVMWSGLPLSVDLDPSFRRAVEQTIRQLQKSGVVNVSEGVPRGFYCENRKRILLDFYKNNAIHCLVTPSILLLAFFHALESAASDPPGEFRETVFHSALRLRNILKFEFFFNPTPLFLDELDRNMGFFFGKEGERGAADLVGALQKHFENWDDVSVYLRLLGELLESYLTVVRFVKESQPGAVEKKALVQKILKYAEAKSVQGGISFPESVSTQNYTNALLLLENLKIVSVTKDGDKSMVKLEPGDGDLETLSSELTTFLRLMEEKPENVIRPETRLMLTE